MAIMTGSQPIARELTHVLDKYCKVLLTSYGSTEVLSVARHLITDPGNYSTFSCGQIIAGSGAEIKVVFFISHSSFLPLSLLLSFNFVFSLFGK